MRYVHGDHAAQTTDSFVFQQLIPYIGNKRKLLPLVAEALARTGVDPARGTFVDLFAGSGVVARFAKELGFRVVANDWEPYAAAFNACFVACNRAPLYPGGVSYEQTIAELNALAPLEGWISAHLCPADDERYDTQRERMFFMRKNGMRIDAMRERIATLERAGSLSPLERDVLIAPLLYQACYVSNTSGVFKGFHRGWGGKTGTALHRIKSDMRLKPVRFLDNGRENAVYREDATEFVRRVRMDASDVAYIDPPYNQHPYGSNYHVLNTIALWDAPPMPAHITGHGDKSAIRTDWRLDRRSSYNTKAGAPEAYEELLATIPARWVLTSYSTDGNIDLASLVRANVERGTTCVVMREYKRYRVSPTRRSAKPVNVEFVLVTDTRGRGGAGADEIVERIRLAEQQALALHPDASAQRGGRGRGAARAELTPQS